MDVHVHACSVHGLVCYISCVLTMTGEWVPSRAPPSCKRISHPGPVMLAAETRRDDDYSTLMPALRLRENRRRLRGDGASFERVGRKV